MMLWWITWTRSAAMVAALLLQCHRHLVAAAALLLYLPLPLLVVLAMMTMSH
jgi:hypothetical protein